MAAKKQLSEDVKRFIVTSLAVYDRPSEVVEAVKEKFHIKITRAGIQCYDPTKAAGADLSEELNKIFTEAREKFDNTEEPPLSKKRTRLKRLNNIADKLEDLGNLVGAADIMEQIAKEQGDHYTNRFKVEQNIQAQHSVVRVPPKQSAEEWSKQFQPPPSEK